MGLIEKIKLWKTRGARHYYKHRSPLLSIAYYLDQKLNITEGLSKRVDPKLVLNVVGREVQFSLGALLAEHHGCTRSYTILPNGRGDVDIVILDQGGRIPLIAYEVKLGKIEAGEARKAIEKIHSYGIPKAGLISLSSKPPTIPCVYETLGPEDLISVAEKIQPKALNI